MLEPKYRFCLNDYQQGALAILILICLFFAGCGDPRIPGEKAVNQAIARSADYLVGCTGKDGKFEYRINLDSEVELQEKYNILRHAGTIYAMCMSYERDASPELKAAILRAGRFLQREGIQPIPGRDDLLAIWSEPDLDSFSKEREAKLGGTGLGLVALLSIEKIQSGFTPLPILRSLGKFLQFMQKPNGSFYTFYALSQGGRCDEWTSLYYPGEAALGLAMLHGFDPDPAWLNSAAGALDYLASLRRNQTEIPADHWALLATGNLLKTESRDQLPVPPELLVAHAVQICETILQDQVSECTQAECTGGFAEDGRTCPTATRLEGLLATLEFLPEDHTLRPRLEDSVREGIAFLLRAQIQDGEYAGGFPRAVAEIEETDPSAENFNDRATEVRIDYVQHAMSALIQYAELLEAQDQG